jgi:SAM-dependent methyltransferase
MRSSFFADPSEDDDLEPRNEIFWRALIDRIRSDGFPRPPRRVLDVGCHRGGLLATIASHWQPDELVGIEPIESARIRARLRLQAVASRVVLLDTNEWSRVADESIDVIVSHETLFLIPDLGELLTQVRRVLAPEGRAYVAAGCHPENPVWHDWAARLRAMGHRTYDHYPMDVMACAARCGLSPSVRPLRDAGWATHTPGGQFTFPTVSALLDHQFKHKLLFRLSRP